MHHCIWLALCLSFTQQQCWAFLVSHPTTPTTSPLRRLLPLQMNGGGKGEQAQEALQALGDFHQGSWTGKATSFTVTADIAAGIVQKKTSPNYQVNVKLSYNGQGVLSVSEVYSWQKEQQNNNSDDLHSVASARSLSLADSSMDIDSVDASYSLHQYSNKPKQTPQNNDDNDDDDDDDDEHPEQLQQGLPVDIIGTDRAVQFTVEHCLAVNDDERIRLWALYGTNQDLIRVVLGEEYRIPEPKDGTTSSGKSLTTNDLLELQSDVDRIVDKIAGQVKGMTPDPRAGKNTNDGNGNPSLSSDEQDRLKRLQDLASSSLLSGSIDKSSPSSSNLPQDDGSPLARHPMSLLELTSGVWLGDSIIRDFSAVPGKFESSTDSKGKGFGSSNSNSNSKKDDDNNDKSGRIPFGSWTTGVQKVAREWLWNFGEEIRENNEAGKSMGVEMEPGLCQSMAGNVCENQFSSRRIPKDQRMVYIDWNNGNGDNHVGFLLGSVSIQVPRYMTFGNTRQKKPFYTELCVYQSPASTDDKSNPLAVEISPLDDNDELPEVICSRICRLYDSEGSLKQACTSFYTLKRFGPDTDSQGS